MSSSADADVFGASAIPELVAEALESEGAVRCRLLGVGMVPGLGELVLVFSDADQQVWSARTLPGSLTNHGAWQPQT